MLHAMCECLRSKSAEIFNSVWSLFVCFSVCVGNSVLCAIALLERSTIPYSFHCYLYLSCLFVTTCSLIAKYLYHQIWTLNHVNLHEGYMMAARLDLRKIFDSCRDPFIRVRPQPKKIQLRVSLLFLRIFSTYFQMSIFIYVPWLREAD